MTGHKSALAPLRHGQELQVLQRPRNMLWAREKSCYSREKAVQYVSIAKLGRSEIRGEIRENIREKKLYQTAE